MQLGSAVGNNNCPPVADLNRDLPSARRPPEETAVHLLVAFSLASAGCAGKQ
jgi:hypothetical protein